MYSLKLQCESGIGNPLLFSNNFIMWYQGFEKGIINNFMSSDEMRGNKKDPSTIFQVLSYNIIKKSAFVL